MNVAHEFEKEGCKVEIWHDEHADCPNDWNGKALVLVTFDSRHCHLTSEGKYSMDITKKEDVRRFLPWTEDVPEDPVCPEDEPDPDCFPDDADGQAEYDQAYLEWEEDNERYAAEVDAYEPFEEWENEYTPGYRVFTVSAYIHGGVCLYFGEEIDYHEKDEFDAAYGFVVVRCADFEQKETMLEEFSRVANGEKKPDRVLDAAKSYYETVNQYVQGEVHGYTVEFPDGESHSCGGYFGSYDCEDIMSEVNTHIDNWVSMRDGMIAMASADDLAAAVRAVKAGEAETIVEEGQEAMVAFLASQGWNTLKLANHMKENAA